MRIKMQNNTERLTKKDMIKIMKILQWHTDLVMDVWLQHFQANKKCMKLEQDLHYEKHKSRYLVRRIKEMAKQLEDPDYAVTEEELNEQIKKSEN